MSRKLRMVQALLVVLAIAALVVGGFAVAMLLHRGSGTAAPQSAGDPTTAVFAHPQLVQTYLAAATTDIAAVSSYDYRRLGDALTAGRSVTTGRYRHDYVRSLTGPVGHDARAHHVVQSFQLEQVGIGAMAADGRRADVLVFGVRSVTDDTTGPSAPRTTPVVLTAAIVRQGAQFLIADLAADTNAGLPPGSAGLAAAAESARAAVVARVGPVEAVAVQAATGAGATVLLAAAHGSRVLRYVVTVVRQGGQWAIGGASAVPPY